MAYVVFRDNRGVVDAVNRESDGASLPYYPETKTFDEEHPLVIEMREWLADGNILDLSDRSPPTLSLATAKLQVQQAIIDLAATKQEALTAGYSATEQSTWDRKEQEAKDYLKLGDLANAKYLKAEAAAMAGTSNADVLRAATKELAQAVVDASDNLRLNSGKISGTRARKWRDVEALSTVEEVLAYPVEAGW